MERSGCPNRELIRGLGERILFVVMQHASPEQLAPWINVAIDLSTGDADFAQKLTACCELRRQGEFILSVVMEHASHETWCDWVQVPLDHARLAGDSYLVDRLQAARAGHSEAAVDTQESNKITSCCAGIRPSTRVASCCSKPPPEGATAAAASSSPCCGGSPKVVVVPPSCSGGPADKGNACAERRESVSSESPFSSSSNAASGGAASTDRAASSTAGGLENTLPIVNAAIIADPLSLHRATMARDIPRMLELLASGVDRDATDLWSCTALHRAAEQSDVEPVRVLLAAGLDVRARDMEGYSALHFAAARGSEAAIVDLLAKGAPLSDRGNNGDTPLHSAVRFLSLRTAELLLKCDADENAKNSDGHTPIDVTGVLPDGREMENQPDPTTAQEIIALLLQAPAWRRSRIWKRRGWLVMLRARTQASTLETGMDVDAAVDETCAPHSEDGAAAECNYENMLLQLESTSVSEPINFCQGGSPSGGCVAATANRAFGELVNQTALLAEAGVFQNIVLFL